MKDRRTKPVAATKFTNLYTRLIDEVRSDLATLDSEYRWLHAAVYGLGARGTGRGARGAGRPTETAALSRDSLQHKVHEAERTIAAAAKAVRLAKLAATTTYRLRDVRELHEPPSSERALDDRELAAMYEAQERRQSRGEGFGEA